MGRFDYVMVILAVIALCSLAWLGHLAVEQSEPEYRMACTNGVRVVPLENCTE
ncbi:MAG: hypothetical protein RIA09_15925 [Hoeflea sp.]|jgi:lipopolysaccharide export system protein LptC|uniref:hypothetical protein n=1 Tax=Hoeflea sp. TaxID=1940281 RepID=UPI0032EEC4F4